MAWINCIMVMVVKEISHKKKLQHNFSWLPNWWEFMELYYFKIKLQCRSPMNLVFYDSRVLCFLPIRFEIRHNGLPEDAAWFPSSIFSKTLLKPNWWEIESSSQLSPPAGHIRLEQWILHESLCWQNKSINLYPF